MSKVRAGGEPIRKYILESVERHPTDVAKRTADHFAISRQAVNKHLQKLVEEGALVFAGNTRNRTYRLAPLVEWRQTYGLGKDLAEDVVWRSDIQPTLGNLPENLLDIWHYGFTEMLNNVLDHSEGSLVTVRISKTAVTTEMALHDDGVGIFKKIQLALNLIDERHAVLELAKGKLTTDPRNHSGEGIFFTSRTFDDFQILSGGVYFSHQFGTPNDWILERDNYSSGTNVWMKISNHTARTIKKIFDQYTSGDEYAFSKTIVPVRMAQYGDDKLISRSQAKRLLMRVDKFKVVIFDFEGVDAIGQAFADEVFRVYSFQHPDIEIADVNANAEVSEMIERARIRRNEP